jgi:hypothetical protein
MRRTWVFLPMLFLLLVLGFATTASSQTSASSDTTALTAFAQMFAATGWQAGQIPQDAVATGTVIRYRGDSQDSVAVTFKAKNASEYRSDVTDATGTNTFIANGDSAALTTPQGTQLAPSNAALATRFWVFPFFSTLVSASGSSFAVQSAGTETINGQPCLRIEISPQSVQGDPMSSYRVRAGHITLWIAISSGLPAQLSYMRVANDNPTALQECTRQFSDWRPVSGIAVPFHQDEYVGAQQVSSLQLESVNLNTGLSDSDFTLPSPAQ